MIIRVLIADDQSVIRDGLATLLGLLDDVEIVATAADGIEAVERAHSERPDIVPIDLRMPRLDGAEDEECRGLDGGQSFQGGRGRGCPTRQSRRCALRAASLVGASRPSRRHEATEELHALARLVAVWANLM